MKSEDGKYQSTKGIWLSHNNNRLILDVEGTDSRERNLLNHNLSNESKLSLFSLVIADVFIINIWYHDIGRYNATNMNLLTTIFELNLQLYQSNNINKKRLIFIIKDYSKDNTSLDILQSILLTDINKIWNNINKPKKYTDYDVNTFFDISFHTTSHMILDDNSYNDDINKLKSLIDNLDIKSQIPIDGLDIYMDNLWKDINNNKDLNLPSQREIVSSYRCQEIYNNSLSLFESSLLQYQNGKLINNFKDTMIQLLDNTLLDYNKYASRYDNNIRDSNKVKLIDSCHKLIKDILTDQIYIINKDYISNFNNRMDTTFSSIDYNFQESAMDIYNSYIDSYDLTIDSLLIPNTNWSFSNMRTDLVNSYDNIFEQYRDKQITLILDNTYKIIKEIYIDDILNEAKDDMWIKIREKYITEIDKVDNDTIKFLNSLNINTDSIKAEYNNKKIHIIKNKVTLQIKQLSHMIEKRFNNSFRSKYMTVDKLDNLFNKGKTEAKKLINLFSIFRLDQRYDKSYYTDDDIPEDLILMEKIQCQNIINIFDHWADSIYIQVKQERDYNNRLYTIPNSIWLVIFFLGFNELLWLFGNPMLLVLSVILLSIYLSISQLYGGPVKYSEDQLNYIINKVKDYYNSYTKKDST
jgi:hypothetical protein